MARRKIYAVAVACARASSALASRGEVPMARAFAWFLNSTRCRVSDIWIDTPHCATRATRERDRRRGMTTHENAHG